MAESKIGMTEAEYLDTEGTVCPYCKSTEVTYSPFEHEAIQVWQDAECQVCKQTWERVFQLAWYN